MVTRYLRLITGLSHTHRGDCSAPGSPADQGARSPPYPSQRALALTSRHLPCFFPEELLDEKDRLRKRGLTRTPTA